MPSKSKGEERQAEGMGRDGELKIVVLPASGAIVLAGIPTQLLRCEWFRRSPFHRRHLRRDGTKMTRSGRYFFSAPSIVLERFVRGW